MRIKDRPEFKSKAKPLAFAPGDMVSQAAEAMAARGFGSVVITDPGDRLIGLVTERDILTRLVTKGLDPQTTTLETIMTRDVRAAREEDEILDWLRMMSNERFRRLPVVDDDGKVIAIMTQGDFVSYTWPDLLHQAAQLSKATVNRFYQIMLVGGGILLYVLVILTFLNSVDAF